MTDKQPEALLLADALEAYEPVQYDAASELRRLHADLQEADKANAWLQEVNARVSAQRDELLEVAKRMHGWVAVLSKTFDIEMDDIELELTNSKTGALVTVSLQEHFVQAAAAIRARSTQ